MTVARTGSQGQNVGAPTLLGISDLFPPFPVRFRHSAHDQKQLSRHRSMRLLTYNRPVAPPDRLIETRASRYCTIVTVLRATKAPEYFF